VTIGTPFTAKIRTQKLLWSWLVSAFAAGVFLFGAWRNGLGGLLVLLPGSLPFIFLKTDIRSEWGSILATAFMLLIDFVVYTFFHFALFSLPKMFRNGGKSL
jgi:hypothetical protein